MMISQTRPDIEEEVWQLTLRVLDGIAEPEEKASLEQLLETVPEAMSIYLDCIALHADARRLLGKEEAVDGQHLRQMMNLRIAGEGLMPEPSRAAASLTFSQKQQSITGKDWLRAAALVMLVTAIVSFLVTAVSDREGDREAYVSGGASGTDNKQVDSKRLVSKQVDSKHNDVTAVTAPDENKYDRANEMLAVNMPGNRLNSRGVAQPLKKLDYGRDIRPILADKCFSCHGFDAKTREADLRLDTFEGATADIDGIRAIVPGNPDDSELMYRVLSKDRTEIMPPPKSHKTLSEDEIKLLRRWIKEGADYQAHWAYMPPVTHMPANESKPWGRNVIDDYVFARLQSQGIKPNAEADRRTLIRRLYFDLTGLPPSAEAVDAFVNDRSPDAYERVVDQLLASEHYGERMAAFWLDLVRYADSAGYHGDQDISIWPYREYVIHAFNSNMPFDQFTREQIAGDLLPDATDMQLVASGYNRLNQKTAEGGAQAKEYTAIYRADRVRNVTTVWMAMTLGCAQCHDHKYDPLTMKDFYSLGAFFADVAQAPIYKRPGRGGGWGSSITALMPSMVQEVDDLVAQMDAYKKQQGATKLEAEIKTLAAEIELYHKQHEAEFQAWLVKASAELKKRMEAGDAQVNTKLPGNALVYGRLNEGKGENVVVKVKGKPKKMTVQKPSWLAAPRGQGLKFKGNSSLVLGYIGAFEKTDAFSFGGWLRIAKDASGSVIAKMDRRLRGYDLFMEGDKVSVHLIDRWPASAIKVTTQQPIKHGWQHVFVTYDGSGKAAGIKLYVGGEVQPVKVIHDKLKGTIKTKAQLILGKREKGNHYHGAVDEFSVFARALSKEDVQRLANHDITEELLALPEKKRTKSQLSVLRRHYFAQVDTALTGKTKRLNAANEGLAQVLASSEYKSLKKKHQTLIDSSETLITRSVKPREVRIHPRGNWLDESGDVVTPAVPENLGRLSLSDGQTRLSRLDLANWLVAEENPLTARVLANRLWKVVFGEGLCRSMEDFGLQGESPTHPLLLDYLAQSLLGRDGGSKWDIKRTIRLLVTSATYRQSSVTESKLTQMDPYNHLLARQNRYRLDAEMVRDNALQASNLLAHRLGGPSVKPYQPAGYYEHLNFPKRKYVASEGADLWRRSVYTHWQRTFLHPSMQAFDAPSREECTAQRSRSNTPLQALILMNDPIYVEAARAMAEKLLHQDVTKQPAGLVKAVMQQVLQREPDQYELEVLVKLFETEYAHYQAHPEEAEKLTGIGEYVSGFNFNDRAAELAAATLLCRTVLNLHETVTRN